MKGERRNELRLPAIQSKQKDGSKVLAATMPDNGARLRPASLNKVEDLEKKLFSKLDAYETAARKSGKRGSKKRVGEGENGPDMEGYERLQKLMPALYGKLQEAKRGSSEAIPAATPASYKSLASLSNRHATASSEGPRTHDKHVSLFLTTKQKEEEQRADKKEQADEKERADQKEEADEKECAVSQAEMRELYLEYLRKEELPCETSAAELAELGGSLETCEREIWELRRSMEGLIREIGLECAGLEE